MTLEAIASSSLPVSYEIISGEDVARVEGDKLEILAGGDVTLRAFQNGNTLFNPTSKTVQFSIPKLEQRMIWQQSFDGSVYGDTIPLEATASSGLPVHFSVIQGSARIDGESDLVILRPGVITIEAQQHGNNIFAEALSEQVTITAGKAPLRAIARGLVMQVGEFNPKTQNVLVVDYDGFRFEDSDAILDAPPAPSTSATIDSPAGIYTISFLLGTPSFTISKMKMDSLF